MYWNKASEEIYGYSAEEAIGRNLLDLIIPPELQEKVKQGIAYMAGTGQPIPSSELLLMRKDGSRISVFSSHTIIQIPGKNQELFCIDIDLTELHQVSESLRESEDRFRAISEYSNSAICIVDENARITWGNEALVKLGGYPAEELYASESFLEFLAPESVDFVMNNFMLFLTGKEYAHNYTFYLKQKSGELRLCEKYMTDYTDKAGKRFLAISMLDITDRHNAQQELIKAKEKAEESDRLKSAFLANMSHEIRTPMNGILGFTELLKRPDLSGEKQRDYIHIIRQSGERLINIINDIIDISKIESGVVTVDFSDFNLDELLDFMYSFFKPEADLKGIGFTCRKPDQSGMVFIRSDHEKLSDILTNLLKNAIKFTKSGFIEFGYHLKGQVLEFYVKDSGTGVAKEHIELIFERFRQGSDSLSREYEGAGLGLSIAKAYTELLGGGIRVESEYQKGCVFHFTIPWVPVKGITEHVPEPVSAPVASPESVAKKQDLTILIVEDDEASGLYLFLTLKNLYSKVLLVESGLEAVNLCKSDPSVRVVLMDLKMPGMSGFEATKLIREFNKELIIIAQTAFAFKSDRDLAINAGCNDYISKPIKPEDLINMINSSLNENRNMNGQQAELSV